MSETISLYKKLLFTYPQESQDFKTYAIVDSIRDERIKEKMVFTELNYLDLWDEELFENEQKVPLFLIELKVEDALCNWLLKNHDKNASIYFQSQDTLETLQDYYSKYTFPYVQMKAKGYEDTPRGIFGFYDPKVLPDFMQSLYTQEKREHFFADITLLFCPDVDKRDLCHIYYPKEGQTAYRSYTLEEGTRLLNLKSISIPIYNTLTNEEIPTIDEKQIAIFERLNHERFVKEVLQEIETSLSDKEIKELLPSILEKSYYAKESLGIDSQANMARFVQVSTQLPKPIEYYAQSTEFKALQSITEQSEKREILQALMQKLNLKEVV